MIKSRAVFAASAVFLSTALAASLFINHKPHLNPSQVLTWDCEYPSFKPETIMIYCADGGAYISKIHWSKWGQDGATGTGGYYRNLCNPDCADGKIVHAPVTVALSDLTPRKGKFYLRTIDIHSASGKDFPWGESREFTMDVMQLSMQQLNKWLNQDFGR
jgi:hypothetical protein